MKHLNPWGPWENNPSKSENFYEINEEFKNDENNESLDETVIDEIIEKTTEKVSESVPSEELSKKEDPYASILKDLK